jgi:5-methylthioadenosine/S-adenosylhomocysteine deaminase
MGTVNGGKNLNLPIGSLQRGYAADFIVVDLEDLSMLPAQNATKNLVYSMMPSAIQAVYVAGKKIFEMGEILTVPEGRIVEKVKTLTENWT